MKKWICLCLVLILALGFAVPASAASYKVASPKWVTIDGKVSEKEWGKPIYKGVTLKKAEEGKVDDQVTAWWYDTTHNKDASFDLYVTNNDKYIGLACVIHNVDEDGYEKADWRKMGFHFSLSPYDEETGVPHGMYQGKEYEHYTSYRIYQKADGSLVAQCRTQGMTMRDIYPNADYIAKYDPATRTMTYEVLVPYSYTKVVLGETEEMAFSATVALDYYSNSVSASTDGSNRFLIGTAAQLCGGAGKYAHKGHCIRIKLATKEQIDKVKPKSTQASYPQNTTIQDMDTDFYSEPAFFEKVMLSVESNLILWISAGVGVACVITIVLVCLLGRKKKKPTSTGEGGDQS